MKSRILLGAAMIVALSGAMLVGTTSIASAHPSKGPPVRYTCAGGDLASGNFISIPSGNYASITVTGACNIQPDAVINVAGNINVAPGAALDAQSAPSTITVRHDVTAGLGSFLGLGCQPVTSIGTMAGVPCTADPAGHTTITIKGNVTAILANTVLMRGMTVKGNVTLIGGGGDIPWSIKGNTIGRNATLIKITATDPGDPGRSVAVVENTVGRNLICAGLAPAVSGGFIPGEVNHVGGKAIGQCASLV